MNRWTITTLSSFLGCAIAAASVMFFLSLDTVSFGVSDFGIMTIGDDDDYIDPGRRKNLGVCELLGLWERTFTTEMKFIVIGIAQKSRMENP